MAQPPALVLALALATLASRARAADGREGAGMIEMPAPTSTSPPGARVTATVARRFVVFLLAPRSLAPNRKGVVVHVLLAPLRRCRSFRALWRTSQLTPSTDASKFRRSFHGKPHNEESSEKASPSRHQN